MPSAHCAAREGTRARERYGALPRDLQAAMAWCRAVLGIRVDLHDDLPISGLAYPSPIPGRRGCILLRPGLGRWRWTLAHEIAHLMLGALGQAQLQLSSDDDFWRRVPAERNANEWASCFLLSVADLGRQRDGDWTRAQMARYHGVPGHTVDLRWELARVLRDGYLGRPAYGQLPLIDAQDWGEG